MLPLVDRDFASLNLLASRNVIYDFCKIKKPPDCSRGFILKSATIPMLPLVDRDFASLNLLASLNVIYGFCKIKKPPDCSRGFILKSATTYSPTYAVPLALAGLTSLFGMGRGGTLPL
jgi:hypothetical protein